MGTRCQVKVQNSPVMVYRHWDGYPEGPGVLSVLMPTVQDFMRRRGFDEAYLPARILGAFLAEEEKGRLEDLKSDLPHVSQRAAEGPGVTGYGLDCEQHGDIEYLYTVQENGTIVVEKLAAFGGGRGEVVDTICLTMDPAASNRPAPLTDPTFQASLALRVNPEGEEAKPKPAPKPKARKHRTLDT